MPQILHPFFDKNAHIIKTIQSIKAEKELVMMTLGLSSQLANAVWHRAETRYPPNMAAVILANRCQVEGVRYFGFAGILRDWFKIGQLVMLPFVCFLVKILNRS